MSRFREHTLLDEVTPVITMDGPSGSGKTTLCCMLAHKIGWSVLDSGSLYRLIAIQAIQHNIPLEDDIALAALANTLDVTFAISMPEEQEHPILETYIENGAMDPLLQKEWVGRAASQIAQLPKIRTSLLERQRAFAVLPGLIATGRDMGTIVFPNAPIKIFLTASVEERARRRFQQLQSKNESTHQFEQILADVMQRDQRDSERSIAPLKPASDAIILDSTKLNIYQILHNIVDILSTKGII